MSCQRSLAYVHTEAMPAHVDTSTYPGVLWLRLEGAQKIEDMERFLAAHNKAIDGYAGADYRVLCDIRELAALSPEAAALFEQAKRYSADHANFRGSAVLVRKKVVAMQHERTSAASGVASTELLTDDEEAAWAHLRSVNR